MRIPPKHGQEILRHHQTLHSVQQRTMHRRHRLVHMHVRRTVDRRNLQRMPTGVRMGRHVRRVRIPLRKQPHHTRRAVRTTTMRHRPRRRARHTPIRHRTTPHGHTQLRSLRPRIPLAGHVRHMRRHRRVHTRTMLANMHQHTRKLHLLVLPRYCWIRDEPAQTSTTATSMQRHVHRRNQAFVRLLPDGR